MKAENEKPETPPVDPPAVDPTPEIKPGAQKKPVRFRFVRDLVKAFEPWLVLSTLVFTVITFFCGQHWASKTAQSERETLELSRQDFLVRNRPILSIPVLPTRESNRFVFTIKNVSQVPAVNVDLVTQLSVAGVSRRLMRSQFALIGPGETQDASYTLSPPDIESLERKGDISEFGVYAVYESVPGSIPGWFVSSNQILCVPSVLAQTNSQLSFQLMGSTNAHLTNVVRRAMPF